MSQIGKHIEINIWKACNNKCKFCMSSKPALWDIKFVSLDILNQKLKHYSEKWYMSVWFLWWDISIHPKMVEIVSLSKTYWFTTINIITNWMRFDDFSFAKKIVEAGVTRVNISIHSHIDSIEDSLTQVWGGLQRKFQAIRNFQLLRSQNLLMWNLSLNIVLNKLNYSTMLQTVLFFYRNFWIDDIRINFLWLDDDTKDYWDELKISYTEVFPIIKKLIYISLKTWLRITFDTVPACILYQIDPEKGDYLVKTFLWEDFDHIFEIESINANEVFDWKQRKKNELKMQFDTCLKCVFNESCQGIRKNYAKIYGGSEFIPVESLIHG